MKLSTRRKIESLQKQVNKTSEKWEDKIREICEEMDYHNSSNFSYNIDRLKIFLQDLNNFEPHNPIN